MEVFPLTWDKKKRKVFRLYWDMGLLDLGGGIIYFEKVYFGEIWI